MSAYFVVFQSGEDFSYRFYQKPRDFVQAVVRLYVVGMRFRYYGWFSVDSAELYQHPDCWSDRRLIAVRDNVAHANDKGRWDFDSLEKMLRRG